MRIRREQMQAFQDALNERFIDRVIEQLQQDCPDRFGRGEDKAMRELARHGFERAHVYGLTTELNVYCFIHVMALFGRAFDTDRSFRWAAEILQDESIVSEDDRTERLCDAAEKCLAETEQA